MVKFDVNGAQNVEVSKKVPCEKPMLEQLEIMEEYTHVHAQYSADQREKREISCLQVLYPRLFRTIEGDDLIGGRLDFLPIGFGCVTSVGGVGHYCVFNKLLAFRDELADDAQKTRVDALYNYWLEHDLKTQYCRDVLTEGTIGRFIDCDYPLIATARLSGMMLDYQKLLGLGINGLKKEILEKSAQADNPDFYGAATACLDLFTKSAEHLRDQALAQLADTQDKLRKLDLQRMADALDKVKCDAPETFIEALQLFWLYAMLAGVINYGRLDDDLGPYLARDLQQGRLTEQEAHRYVKSLWTMIENRRTTVNGRVIVGGRGRKHPKEADVFLHIALRVAKECRYVEPQFTLRVDSNTSDEIWDEAFDALGAGATYPTIYNDDVNIPAVQFGMRMDEAAAEQYVPFGCTEYVIRGQSTGTPNVCMNLLKMMTIFMNGGIDPMDGKRKDAGVAIRPLSQYRSFDEFYAAYKELLDAYMDLSIKAQMYSFELMNREVSFLFTSILMDDCLARGKALLDGGVRYLGGTNEIYGIINASDALWAIKDLVFDKKRYTLDQIQEALLANFVGYEALRKEMWDCDKYGNDLETADNMAVKLYNDVAIGVRERGIASGMKYFLVVISNNQLNTEWGRRTAASPDGRYSGLYMNPANNPQGGANQNGPTAMLNSLAKLDARYHAGSVQNIKFTPEFFSENRKAIQALFKAYFMQGGCHIMVTVVGRGVLEDAVKHPENYKDLIVRVSGFSAVFINLESDIQQELMSRMLYDE